MIEVMLNRAQWRAAIGISVNAAPFFKATQVSCIGIVRVERQEYKLVERPRLAQGVDGLRRQGMPVAHCRDGHGLDVGRDRLNQALALPLGQRADGRAPSDLRITSAHRQGPTRRNEFSDWATK